MLCSVTIPDLAQFSRDICWWCACFSKSITDHRNQTTFAQEELPAECWLVPAAVVEMVCGGHSMDSMQ